MHIILIFIALVFTEAANANQCINIEGKWSNNSVGGTGSYREIIKQDKCSLIEINIFHPEVDSPVTSVKILMNDTWECAVGNKNRLECYKGKCVKNDNLLITFARYTEHCLYIMEKSLDYDGRLVTHSEASCPEDLGFFGSGSSWLQRVQ